MNISSYSTFLVWTPSIFFYLLPSALNLFFPFYIIWASCQLAVQILPADILPDVKENYINKESPILCIVASGTILTFINLFP